VEQPRFSEQRAREIGEAIVVEWTTASFDEISGSPA
jgi:hypothetical protein